MPDYTSRLALAKPRGGSSGSTPAEQVDIDVLNGNFDKIDSSIGAANFSSTTRPSTPFPGQIIYESDSRTVEVWTGTEWDGGPRKRERNGTTGTALLTATTNPNTGSGGYQRMYWTTFGGMCQVTYTIYFSGTGVSAGTGNWGLPVPYTSAAPGRLIFQGEYFRASGSTRSSFPLIAYVDGGSSSLGSIQSGDGVVLSNAVPEIGQSTDRLVLSGFYPIIPPVVG